MPRRNRAKERKEREAALRAATMEAEIKLATTRQVTAEAVLGELLRIARVDIGQAFNADGSLKEIHAIPEDVRRAISGIDVEEVKSGGETMAHVKKVRFWDKKGALELLGKHLALFIERHDHTTNGKELAGAMVLPQKDRG